MSGSLEFKCVILESLARVAAQRARRALDPALLDRVHAIKVYQQRRFEATYADLLSSTRYGDASRFFLNELYGPADFTDRDQQFERIVPKLVRMFPEDVLQTLADLALLHADTEELDSEMGQVLSSVQCRVFEYVSAWQAVGQRNLRDGQLRRVLAIGRALDKFTQHAWLVQLLLLMRRPAALAGLARLQNFLEVGMSSFRAMSGAQEFLATIQQREQLLLRMLFTCTIERDHIVVGGNEDFNSALKLLPSFA